MSETPTCQNLSDLLPPEHIRDAAESVRVWMEVNGYRGLWILGGVCSRAYADKVEWLKSENAKLLQFRDVSELWRHKFEAAERQMAEERAQNARLQSELDGLKRENEALQGYMYR